MWNESSISGDTLSRSRAWLVWGGWLLVALGLHFGPSAGLKGVTDLLQSAIGASLAVVPVASAEVASDADPVGAKQYRQLEVENQLLRQQLRELQTLQATADAHQRLAIPPDERLLEVTLLATRILGRKGDPLSTNLQLLVDLGRDEGLHEQDLVLTGSGLLVEGGAQQQIRADQVVTAKQSLFGRVTRVGARTSLVQPMTDEAFRMAVRVYRKSAFGAVEGPVGVLVGTGQGCRLEEVPATEAVTVGDDIYTDPVASPVGTPVFCGRVIQADLQPSANHWSLEVLPASSASSIPDRVEILKSSLTSAGGR